MFIAMDKLGLTAWNVEPFYDEENNFFDSLDTNALVWVIPLEFMKMWGVNLKYGQMVRVIMEIVR